MRQFVIKVEFSDTDIEARSKYNRIVEAIEDAFPEFISDDVFRMALVPDDEISDADIQADNDFLDWVGVLVRDQRHG